jgi:hypothetical protein
MKIDENDARILSLSCSTAATCPKAGQKASVSSAKRYNFDTSKNVSGYRQVIKGGVLDRWCPGLAGLPKIICCLLGNPCVCTTPMIDSEPTFKT